MDFAFEPILFSLVAGLATGIGGIIAVALRRISDRAVGFSIGLASGVMLLVSFNSLFLQASEQLTHFELIVFFSAGALIMMALDLTIPHIELTAKMEKSKNQKILRSGVLIAIGITLHNLPEGFAVTAGYAFTPTLGLIVAIAVMLHNIPEGIATAIPLKVAGARTSRVLLFPFLAGLAEPLAASVAAIVISLYELGSIVGFSLAFAAGIMAYITADELIPVAHEYGHKHTVSVALLLGIILALMVDLLLS